MTRTDITLEEDALAVQDVVVIGYGTTSKEKLTAPYRRSRPPISRTARSPTYRWPCKARSRACR